MHIHKDYLVGASRISDRTVRHGIKVRFCSHVAGRCGRVQNAGLQCDTATAAAAAVVTGAHRVKMGVLELKVIKIE